MILGPILGPTVVKNTALEMTTGSLDRLRSSQNSLKNSMVMNQTMTLKMNQKKKLKKARPKFFSIFFNGKLHQFQTPGVKHSKEYQLRRKVEKVETKPEKKAIKIVALRSEAGRRRDVACDSEYAIFIKPLRICRLMGCRDGTI